MLWEELALTLNSVAGGSMKTWKQWRKTWSDLKKNTKNKATSIKKYQQRTGGEPPIPQKDHISDIDKGILEVIGTVVQKGIENVSETPLNLQATVNKDYQIFEITDDFNLSPVMEADIYDNLSENLSTELTSKEISGAYPIMDSERQTPTPTTSKNMSANHNKLTQSDHSYNLPRKFPTPIKKLTATRRLENSQKTSFEMLKSMNTRTSRMEEYYKKKCQHIDNLESYHKKKIEIEEKKTNILQNILMELKDMKLSLIGDDSE